MELDDQPEDPNADIGISTPDAQAIKQAILASVKDGFVEIGDIPEMVEHLMNAFKDIDSQVFARDEMMRSMKDRLTAKDK